MFRFVFVAPFSHCTTATRPALDNKCHRPALTTIASHDDSHCGVDMGGDDEGGLPMTPAVYPPPSSGINNDNGHDDVSLSSPQVWMMAASQVHPPIAISIANHLGSVDLNHHHASEAVWQMTSSRPTPSRRLRHDGRYRRPRHRWQRQVMAVHPLPSRGFDNGSRPAGRARAEPRCASMTGMSFFIRLCPIAHSSCFPSSPSAIICGLEAAGEQTTPTPNLPSHTIVHDSRCLQ